MASAIQDWKFYDKQLEFMNSKDRVLGFISGIGAGKSLTLVRKAIMKAVENPGSVGLISAPTINMLRDATKRSFFDECPRDLILHNNESTGILTLKAKGGGTSDILFRSTHEEEHLRGPNLLWVAMDEAALSNEMSFDILFGRLRQNPESEQQIMIASTPKGHNWVFNLFGPHVSTVGHKGIFAHTKDNPFLGDLFVESVYSRYSGNFAQQELEGKFVAYRGLIYGDVFSPEKHVGVNLYNNELPVTVLYDPAYPSPTAALILQQDHKGRVYAIDEFYKVAALEEDVLTYLRSKAYFSNITDFVVDEARPDTIVRLVNLGMPARPSRKGKILDGINKVRSLLNPDVVTGETLFHINKATCPELIKEFHVYRWRERQGISPDSVESHTQSPIDTYNHLMDCLRYFATTCWFPKSDIIKPSGIYTPRKRRKLLLQYLP